MTLKEKQDIINDTEEQMIKIQQNTGRIKYYGKEKIYYLIV